MALDPQALPFTPSGVGTSSRCFPDELRIQGHSGTIPNSSPNSLDSTLDLRASLYVPSRSPLSFLDLPFELRKQVYGYLLPKAVSRSWTRRRRSKRDESEINLCHARWAILRVSRQVYVEAIGEFYNRVECHVRLERKLPSEFFWFVSKTDMFGNLILSMFQHVCFDIEVISSYDELREFETFLVKQEHLKSLLSHLTKELRSLRIMLYFEKGELWCQNKLVKMVLDSFTLSLEAVRGFPCCFVDWREKACGSMIKQPSKRAVPRHDIDPTCWRALEKFKRNIETLATRHSLVPKPHICIKLWSEYRNIRKNNLLAVDWTKLDDQVHDARLFAASMDLDTELTLRAIATRMTSLHKINCRRWGRSDAQIELDTAAITRLEMLIKETAVEYGMVGQ